MQRATKEQIRATYKPRDSWWTVFLVDPVAAPATRLVSPWRFVTPNLLTVLAFVLGLGAAACFAVGDWPYLVAGAVLFHLSFTVDCMDGKLARVRGGGNLFGGWLDYICDRLRVLLCAVTLFAGQYYVTGEEIYFYFAVAVVFCDMFRYLNALYFVPGITDSELLTVRSAVSLLQLSAATGHPGHDQLTALANELARLFPRS